VKETGIPVNNPQTDPGGENEALSVMRNRNSSLGNKRTPDLRVLRQEVSALGLVRLPNLPVARLASQEPQSAKVPCQEARNDGRRSRIWGERGEIRLLRQLQSQMPKPPEERWLR
jgi:hypothetical protein